MTIVVSSTPSEDHVVVEVGGDVDMYSFRDLQIQVFAEIERKRPKILLDFTNVGYLDSSGVGCVIRILQQAKAGVSRVAICGLSGTPLKVLQLSHVLKLIDSYESRAAATASFIGE
jgi:anti-sigma B factor antagonist